MCITAVSSLCLCTAFDAMPRGSIRFIIKTLYAALFLLSREKPKKRSQELKNAADKYITHDHSKDCLDSCHEPNNFKQKHLMLEVNERFA